MTMLNVYDRQTRTKTAVLQNAYDIIETHDLNQIYTLSFKLPADDEKTKYCLPRHFVRWGDEGELYRIKAPSQSESNISVITYECEHVITTLCDSIMFGSYTYGGAGVKTSEVIRWLLSQQKDNQDWVLDECDFDRKFEYLWEQENILNALYSIPKEFAKPYKWMFDTTVYPWRISLKEIDPDIEPEFYLRAKSNILASGTAADYANICTRLYPLGYGEGVNQLGIKEINNGIPYIQSPADIVDKYGIVEKVLVDRRFENAESLMAYAQSMLDLYQTPSMSRSFDVTDLYPLTNYNWDNAEVGKICRMTQDDSTAYITKTKWQRDKAGDLQIELSTKATDIAQNVADLADRIRIESVYAQGATQLYQHSKDANATSTKGMVLNLYFPSEMRQINKVLMRVKLEKFRAYSQTAAAAGGIDQNTQSGGAAQITTEAGGAASGSTGESGAVSDKNTGLGGAVKDQKTGDGGAVSNKNTGLGGAVEDKATALGGAVKDQKTGDGGAVSDKNTGLGGAVEDKATALGGAVSDQVTGSGGAVTDKATASGGAVTDKVTGSGGAVTDKATALGGAANDQVTGSGGAVTDKATGSAGAVTNKDTGTGGAVSDIETGSGGAVTNKATGTGGAVSNQETAGGGSINTQSGGGGGGSGQTGVAYGGGNVSLVKSVDIYIEDTNDANWKNYSDIVTSKARVGDDGLLQTQAGSQSTHFHSVCGYSIYTTPSPDESYRHNHFIDFNSDRDYYGNQGYGGEHRHTVWDGGYGHSHTISRNDLRHNHSLGGSVDVHIDNTDQGQSGFSHSHSFYVGDHTHQISLPGHTHTFSLSGHTHTFSLTGHTHKFSLGGHTHKFSITGHTHTFSIPDHTHKFSLPGHTHKFSLSGHTHKFSLSGHTHTFSLPNHTHKFSLSGHTHTFSLSNHTHPFSLNGHTHTFSLNGHTHTFSLSGHTHTFSLNGHTHTFSLPGHTHTFSLNGHTHKFNLSAHTHKIVVNPHTHTITPGIYEFGTPSAFDIYVNGTKKTTVSSTSFNDDITQWLLNDKNQVPRDSWIDVEIRPNDLAYVVSSVFVQGFVQSRGGGNY